MRLHIKKALALIISAVMIITTLLFPGTAFAKLGGSEIKGEYVEGEVICVLNQNAPSNYMKAASTKTVYGKSFSQKDAYKIGSTQTVVLKSSTLSTKEMVNKLKKNPAVKYAVPNFIKHAYSISGDSYSDYQWALNNTGQNGGTSGLDTNADALWDDAESSDEEQVIAIVDTGIDYNHPDLKDVVWNNPYGKKLLGKHGRDFTGSNEDGEPLDDFGHGTHCAGIIAAQANNNEGVSGINRKNIKIMALKFLDKNGAGSLAAALASYDFIVRAVKLGTNVVACNNSWGGAGNYEELMLLDTIFDELGKLGVITFAAAGNESSDLDFDENEEDPYILTPAACQSDYVITVAATNENDELASFSNYGKNTVDISAQGTDILSTVSYNCFNPTILTTEERTEYCGDYFQSYDSPVAAGDFGYLNDAAYDTEGPFAEAVSRNYSLSYVDGYGTSGKALKISLNEPITKKRSLNLYAFEVPFTLANADEDYSIGLVVKGNAFYDGAVFDVPASSTLEDAFGEREEDIDIYGLETDNYWDAKFVNIDVDPVDEDGKPVKTDYEKATDRKLLIVIGAYDNDTVITIDNLAISKQGLPSDTFGKYDFYNGTSMATPYVTGAAALIKCARPDASVLDIINMIKNTGRKSTALDGKTQNAKVLSLDGVDKIPPMITGAGYDKDKNIEIKGSFRSITKVTANGEEVTPLSIANNSIVISDNDYNTKKLTVTVENPYDSKTFAALISDKEGYERVEMEEIPDTYSTFAIPAGDVSYYVSSVGSVGMVTADEDTGEIDYMEIGQIEAANIYKDGASGITSATYLNNSIYACMLHYISGSYNEDAILGYEASLVRLDLNTMTTTKIAEIPDEALSGSTLTTYNGSLYLIGGCDFTDTYTCYDSVYKLNTNKMEFDKMATSLPEGRAAANFIQYKDKLIGFYGMNNDGTMPCILIYDGSTWKKSTVTLESDDPSTEMPIGSFNLRVFEGNTGYSSNGIFANGPYVYGLGDSFIYNPDTDTVTACENSAKNTIGGKRLVGTTVRNYFIGFAVQSLLDSIGGDVAVGSLAHILGDEVEDENNDISEITGSSNNENINYAYFLDVNAKYAKVDLFSGITNAYATNVMNENYVYGDALKVTLQPDAGYAITSIKANGKVVSTNSNSARVVVNSPTVKVTNTTKLVAAPIANVKLSTAGATICTLAWSKAKAGAGYQLQKKANGKWTTIATIKNISTTSYKVAVKAGTISSYRVRSFGTYNGKTYYGEFNGMSIYVPKAQAISSVKGAKGSFTVNYAKDGYVSGYEVDYSTSNTFKNKKTAKVKTSATVKKTVKTKKGKYYVRVRGYKVVGDKTIYGAYSKTTTVTVK